jgi:hypothetical protein
MEDEAAAAQERERGSRAELEAVRQELSTLRATGVAAVEGRRVAEKALEMSQLTVKAVRLQLDALRDKGPPPPRRPASPSHAHIHTPSRS